jgi:hypothetical protein
MHNFPEKPSGKDRVFQAARAVVSAVPGAGGPLQVFLENIFAEPLERRRVKWFKELGFIIEQIQERIDSFDLEELSSNEVFITTVMHASQIVMRNHQDEKLRALRNAVLNSGLPNPPSEDEQSIFLYLVDRLTPWHLRILSLLDNPTHWLNKHRIESPNFSAGAGHLLEYCFPELRDEKELYRQVAKDLQSSGLLTEGSYMNAMMTIDGVLQSRTAPLGKKFLSFVSDPLES